MAANFSDADLLTSSHTEAYTAASIVLVEVLLILVLVEVPAILVLVLVLVVMASLVQRTRSRMTHMANSANILRSSCSSRSSSSRCIYT